MANWKRIAFITAALVLTDWIHVSALAGPLEDGNAALDRQDYQTALKLLRPLADQGNTTAMVEIGGMYKSGRGVKEDKAEAVRWVRKAADQGSAFAQTALGGMYVKGEGVKQSYEEAEFWVLLGQKTSSNGKTSVANMDRMFDAQLTPVQRAAVDKRVADWKPTSTPATSTKP